MADWGKVLAAGVNGYLRGTDIVASRARQDEDDAYMKERRAREKAEWTEKDALKSDLKNASVPVEVVEGSNGAVLPETMDNRDVGMPGEAPLAAGAPFRVGSQAFANAGAANTAAIAANSPEVIAGRQAQVYQRHGMPAEATTLESKQAALRKQAIELKKSGVLEGVNALRMGNKDQAVKALKGSGMFEIDGDVSMEPEDIDIPGVGKVKSYNLKFNTKNPDGTVAPMTLNSHILSMGMVPYEKQLELMRKGSDSEAKNSIAAQRLDLAAEKVGIAGQLAEARIAKMQAGGGGGGGGSSGKTDREYRLILQNQQGNISREIREIDSSIKDLKDREFGKTQSPQMQELVQQRSRLTQQRAAINDEFVGLAEKKAGSGNENIAAMRAEKPPKTVKTSRGELPKIESKAQYDRLPSGSSYIAPDGKEMKKK